MSRSIVIESIPDGRAPVDIKRQWIGLEIPDVISDFIVMFDLEKKTILLPGMTINVPKKVALAILETRSIKAANWFKNDHMFSEAKYLGFNRDCLKIIYYAEIVDCPDCGREEPDYSCRTCCGSGWIAMESGRKLAFDQVCPICGGTKIFGINEDMTARKCPFCDGTGFNQKATA